MEVFSTDLSPLDAPVPGVGPGLVRELVVNPKGSTVIKDPGVRPWLFPGRRPASPSATTASASASTPSASNRAGTAPPPCSPSPPNGTPRSSPARSLGVHIKVVVVWQQPTDIELLDTVAGAAGLPAAETIRPVTGVLAAMLHRFRHDVVVSGPVVTVKAGRHDIELG